MSKTKSVPSSSRPVASINKQGSGWAVEHHGVAGSGGGFPTGWLNRLPSSRAMQPKPIQSGGKHVLLSATWEGSLQETCFSVGRGAKAY